jgi:hypothetical protein
LIRSVLASENNNKPDPPTDEKFIEEKNRLYLACDDYVEKPPSNKLMYKCPTHGIQEVKPSPMPKKHLAEMILFILVSVLIAVVVPAILNLIFTFNLNLLIIFYMFLTIAIIVFAPLCFPFDRWNSDIIHSGNAKTIIQIDATVIIGILFFLQLTPVQPTSIIDDQIQNSTTFFDPIVSTPSKILLTALTALTLIPFAISAILVSIWGGEKFWQVRDNISRLLNPSGVTGQQMAVAFMIAGFMWIIITMFMLLFAIPL